MKQTIKVGAFVVSVEHPKSVGQVTRVNENGDLTIEWRTPVSSTLPYGHIGLEFWPYPDTHSLEIVNKVS